MEKFFLLLEVMIPIVAGVLILKKGSLAIVYMPTIYYASGLYEGKYVPDKLYYYFFIALLLFFAFFNLPYLKRNIYSNLIILYYLVLALFVDDFILIWEKYMGLMWLFACVPIIPQIFSNFEREKLEAEISFSAFAMMALFVVNVVLSTYFGYNPYEIYRFKGGVLFGKMDSDIYNIFPYAIFVIFRKGIKDNNPLYLGLYFVCIFLILLTLRRSVMALCLFGTLLAMIELVKFEEIKKFILYGLIIAGVATVVLSQTSFKDQFIERFEARGLDKARSLNEENRMIEFGLLYRDLFVYFDYDPWFGYGLLNSSGNYGKQIFGKRSLHTDPTNLIHSSGFLGLGLYLLMFGTLFLSVWKKSKNRADLIRYIFISTCFLVFFINGRYTTTPAMLLMLVIFSLPYAKNNVVLKEQIQSNLNLDKSNYSTA
ncbi:hypothetical protein [Aquiflexum gelatinilyticum]|uniref:O-antigen ligase domain-containing protein n=1 Tax=Aquiflexum gelatinilyticum TaxID=2961943 RepID=A0A9X2P6U9_9BACT|nr:hypothetical protein [Aquiflexum gelatinilyticum]MCR9016492.1 hypothetical protein [Aquiflexum gelatinilyticum]